MYISITTIYISSIFNYITKIFLISIYIPINEFPCNLFLPLAFSSSGWQLTTLKIKSEYARTAKYLGKMKGVFFILSTSSFWK